MASSELLLHPARNLSGSIRLPGDKSISHRYAMLAAMAAGVTRLENFATGADCASTLNCLRGLGIAWELGKDGILEIRGNGPKLSPPSSPLNCGNSGSTMRMLSGILAGQHFQSELEGDASLCRRPMGRVIVPLRQMGAQISAAAGDLPPLRVRGGCLAPIEYAMPVASAQVKSAILFAGLFAGGRTCIVEPVPTRDHSEHALVAFGADLERVDRRICIRGNQSLRPIAAEIPGDLSTAAFFLGAAALFPDSRLLISKLLLNPTRARLFDVLLRMGLQISVLDVTEQHGELVGSVEARGGRLRGTEVSGAEAAALIDELPLLAAIAPYTEDGIEIRDAAELRVKESDRVAAMVCNLRAMGAEVEERIDGMWIGGNQKLRGAEVDSWGDHRITMASAMAALRAEGETVIRDAGAAAISYPDFFQTLAKIVER
jgi:3-phosphoshikimate 1-carboxyvinyltransferase